MTARANEAAAYGGMFLFGIVVALLGAVLPLVSEPLGLGLAAVGDLFAAMNGAVLVGSFATGLVIDRFGYRGPLTAGPLVMAAALVLVARAGTPQALAGALALLGLGGSALNSASNALPADLYPEPKAKAAALNRVGVFFGFGALFLPFLIGTLVDRLGLASLLLLAAGLCVAVGGVSALPHLPPPKQLEGLSLGDAVALLRHPLVAVLGVLFFFEAGTEMLLAGYQTTFLIQETGAGVRAASGVLAGYWAALMAGRMLLGHVLARVPGLRLVPLMAGVAAAALALAALAPGFVPAAVCLVVTAFALAGIIPTTLGVAGTALPARTGTVFGLLFSLAVIGSMIIPWVAGHLSAAFSLRVVPVLGVVGFVAVTLLALAVRRLERAS